MEGFLFVIGVLSFASIWACKAGYKLGVPVLLMFLVMEMLFGDEGLRLVKFDSFENASTIGTVALCVILFSGGMDTKLSDIKPVIREGLLLATLGVFLMAVITGFVIRFVFDMMFGADTAVAKGAGIMTSLLLASVMASTDSASVFSLLRSKNLNLKNNLRPLLESESGSNDPVAFIMTVTLITIVKSGDEPDYVAVASDVVVKLVMGGTTGFFIGRFLVWAINKLNIDNAALYPIAILSGCLIIYATAFFVNGNSYLAVYVGGLVIGNSHFVHKRATINFFDGLTWLCQLIMFLIPFPENTLVVMVKRDGKYFVPKGRTELLSGDHLLLITDNKDILIQTLNSVGIAYNNVKADKVESKLLPI